MKETKVNDSKKALMIKTDTLREYKIVKSNDLIQKSRFSLSMTEQKIVLYLISKIKPNDLELKEQVFEIAEFCRICGIDWNNGNNYARIKKILKDLRDKSFWIKLDNGMETTMAWIDHVTIGEKSGKVILKIDDRLKPYLLQLKKQFTQYEVLYILAMKSRYSIRLYELLRSYEYQRNVIFEIEELKRLLDAEKYTRFPDFKRYVLDIAMREINDVSDMNIDYICIKEGRKYAKIEFGMKIKKEFDQTLDTWNNIFKVIDKKKN